MSTASGDIFAIAPDWKGRAFAFFRVLLFIAAFVGLNIGVNYVVAPAILENAALETRIFLADVLFMATTLAITFALSFLARRRFADYGYRGPHAARNLVLGAIAGVALVAALLGVMDALGGFAFGALTTDARTLTYGGLYLITFLAVALNEEALFRGYALVELSRAISFWPAAIVLAALFGFLHLTATMPEGITGAAEAFLFALVAAYSFRATGSLWLIIGLHFGWDYAETFIFGVADSGMASAGSAFHPLVLGPAWLNGGAVGPEGSLLTTIPVLLMGALAAWAGRSRSAA